MFTVSIEEWSVGALPCIVPQYLGFSCTAGVLLMGCQGPHWPSLTLVGSQL